MREFAPRIRVAFYEPYPMGLGGNFLTQRLILEHLDRRRFDPIVMAPRDGAALSHFRSMGVECTVLPAPDSIAEYGGKALRTGILRRVRAGLDLLRYNFECATVLRRERVDLLYTNCVRAQLSVGLAAQIAGIPSFLYVKGELSNPLLDRICLLSAKKIAFLCATNRDDRYPAIIGLRRDDIHIIGIGLDPNSIPESAIGQGSNGPADLELDPSFINTAVIAQLYRPKGQHLVIEALSRLVSDFPKLRLYLAGDHIIDEHRGYRAELEALVDKYKLRAHVRFLGWRTDPLHIAGAMDILIHPSLSEGFGYSVLEAMALEKPVIASAVGGLREAIHDGQNGILVPPGDADAIATRWRQLLRDKELRGRLGHEARRTVLERYLVADKIEAIETLWASMCSQREKNSVALQNT